ncbi:SMC-Scp complex subunit ScpB [Nakamurella lactea]|uniref:SMC-Scp complex subunit ScpB n=1 Tax=Nakamurella lactea TaxID=459515 RepID=UPI000409314D|nr:SMC-Scp complex subunit ScpB [Nakamurella lactea]
MSSESDPGTTGLTTVPEVTGIGVSAAEVIEPEATEAGTAGPEEVELDEAEAVAEPAIADDELAAALEAVLLVVDSPVSEQALAVAVGRTSTQVRTELLALADRLRHSGSGIDLREIGGGWRFYTREKFAPVVERFVLDGQQTRLSRAALETLAVIAYRQPVTRARIAGVRGVNVDGVIRTLVARGLIEEVGTDGETGAMLYRTTELFTERLGLNSLEELPEIGPLLPEVDAIDDV